MTVPEIIQLIKANINYTDELGELIQFVVEPSKNLDPHKIIRQLSDTVLNTLYQKSPDGPLSQYYGLFEIETMWRRGQLQEDWEWVWLTDSEGTIRYLKKPN